MPTDTLPRRRFLQALSAGALLPATATASPIPARVTAMRQEWADLKRSYLDTLFHDRPDAGSRLIAEASESLGDGLGAMKVYKDFVALDAVDQTHPAMQALIRDAVDAVGASVLTSKGLVRGWLDGHGENPQSESFLRAGLQSLRFTIKDWRYTAGHRGQLEQTLLELEHDASPGALHGKARKLLRKIARTERIAAQLAVSDTALLTTTDPAVLRRVRAAHARWGVPAAEGSSTVRALGLLLLGLVAVGGLLLTISGIACIASCGSGFGFVLVGLAITGLSVWAAIRVAGKDVRPSDGPDLLGDALEDSRFLESVPEGSQTTSDALPGLQVLSMGESTITALKTWTATTATVTAGNTLRLHTAGQLRSPAGWVADADGSGIAAGEGAQLPGAPVASLIGRIGEQAFFIGSSRELVVGFTGRLYLGINHDHQQRPLPDGSFIVSYQVIG